MPRFLCCCSGCAFATGMQTIVCMCAYVAPRHDCNLIRAQGLARRDLMQLTSVPPSAQSSSAVPVPGLRAGAGAPPSAVAAGISSAPAAQPQTQPRPEGVFARLACGMALSFSPADARVYLAATEDGPLHRRDDDRVVLASANALWLALIPRYADIA